MPTTQKKADAWVTTNSGTVTFNRALRKTAVKIAEEPNTSTDDRAKFAKEVNSSARSIHQALRERRDSK